MLKKVKQLINLTNVTNSARNTSTNNTSNDKTVINDINQNLKFNLLFPAGHFYSPIADPVDIAQRQNQLFARVNKLCSSINFNEKKQLELLKELKPYVKSDIYPINKPKDDTTYYYGNDQFPALDADFLHAFLCYYQPKNMIEIGSGFSSLITAHVNRNILNNRLNFSCIEPYPLQFLIDGVDGISNLIQKKVQDVDLSIFEKLGEGDILFIDSSHVSKIGSDVKHIFFNILPCLNKGVKVHFHDIFLPDEYPKRWMLDENRNWNEQYLLKAFLQYNEEWEVFWASHYMGTRFTKKVQNIFPNYPKLGGGGSLWIKKL